MEIELLIELISVLAVAVSAIFALMQWLGSLRVSRAKMVKKLLDAIRSKPDIREAWYYLEYHEEDEWYNDDFHGSDLEKKMDCLLSHMNYICYLIESKILTKKEAELFQYQIRSVSTNNGLQCYFFNIYHYAHWKESDCSFEILLNYAKKNGYLPEEFFDKNNPAYSICSFNECHMKRS